MKILCVIPARFASTRFPGKPLVDIKGKSMIQRVYEQANKCSLLSEVIVATDDQRIFSHCETHQINVLMTSASHESGTDRCAEVATKYQNLEVVINLQGDEPFISPSQIELLASSFSDKTVNIASLVKKIETELELFDVSKPKVVMDKDQNALLFSRQTIPYIRKTDKNWLQEHTFYKHIGIYGFRRDTLMTISKLQKSSLEIAESLEQLRWLENGFKIKMQVTQEESFSIDTPEDLKVLLSKM